MTNYVAFTQGNCHKTREFRIFEVQADRKLSEWTEGWTKAGYNTHYQAIYEFLEALGKVPPQRNVPGKLGTFPLTPDELETQTVKVYLQIL